MLGLVVPFALLQLLLSFPSTIVAQRGLHHSSLPEDLYAFPKYQVSFLNGLPVLNETAQRWLAEGLTGGDSEFLGSSPALEPAPEETQTAVSSRTGPPADGPVSTLHHMRMGPQSYLCLIPPPPDVPPPADDFTQPPAPAKSWELLAPLKGTCLYHRQGWFTYSYCHGEHVRQFRALTTNQPNTPGGRVPQEDKDEASYTLGHAPSSDVAVNDEQTYANGLETARGAGHRYLVQRWGEGTVCDKTGRKREIEVQFHCSMTTTDVILFVKETRTCHYTLVIHTPRLCGEPGFKSPHDDLKETVMRCRHIVDSLDRVDNTLPDAPYPLTRAPKPPPPLVGHSKSDPSKATSKGKGKQQKPSEEFIRMAIEALMGDESLMDSIRGRKDGTDAEVVVVMEGDEGEGEPRLILQETGETLGDVLKKAGYDIKGSKSGKGKDEEDEEGVVEEIPSHDEL